MLVDYTQKRDGIDVSYVNQDKQIIVENLPLKKGYYKYIACEDWDTEAIPGIRSFKRHSAIKRETDRYFSHHNINEFFSRDLKTDHPSEYERMSQLNVPNPFSVDIETDITDKFGYSTPERAENIIRSISITDVNLSTILFIVKNPNQPEFKDSDKMEIKSVIMNALGASYGSRYEYDFDIRVFDTEGEMLAIFCECVNKYFHCLIGWNILLFDWIWIVNRCIKNGIDIKKASPTFRSQKKKIKLKNGTEREVILPVHRPIVDSMRSFEKALIYNNLESYSLNFVSELILKLKKVMFEGNLRKLYEEQYNKFCGYAIIDTILVMLLHKATNLLNIDFFESYYNNVPYSKITQNAISEALVFNELALDGLFLLESEFNKPVKRDYKGGYVKKPTKKQILAGAGLDFSGLYPNSMITIFISPDGKIDAVEVDEMGRPANPNSEAMWQKYKAMGYTLSPMGRIYDGTTDKLFVRIEKKLIAQRKIFKGHAEDIYLNLQPKLEKVIEEKKALAA
jgi:DNA polymerase elongation subunit (family B)